jgi:hypothetical protein
MGLVAADAGRGRPLGNRSLCDQNVMILLQIVIPLYSSIFVEHDFSGKPACTFPDHALGE